MRWAPLFLLVVLATPASADERAVGTIVKTVRFHPYGEPARVGLAVLGDRGPPGWAALASIVQEYRRRYPSVARAGRRTQTSMRRKKRLVNKPGSTR